MTAAGAGAWGIPCRGVICCLSAMGEGVTEEGREGERAGGTGGGFDAAGLDAALDADVALGVMMSDGAGRFVCVCAGSAGSSIVPSPNSISMTPAPCCPCCCSTVSTAACSTAAVASDVTTGKPHWARNMSTRSLASATLVAFATIRRISCTSEACVAGRLGMHLVETETEVELEFDRIGLGAVELGPIG
jgi:D-tyrosyl-tRNA(Tyr) deacylase